MSLLPIHANVQGDKCSLGEPGVVGVAVRALVVHKVERRLSFLLAIIAQNHLHHQSDLKSLLNTQVCREAVALNMCDRANKQVQVPDKHCTCLTAGRANQTAEVMWQK